MTMTLSPQSTWGVYVGLCLPRSRMATIEASRPTMRPSASIITHFFSTSAGFAEKVFISASIWESADRQAPGIRLFIRSGYGYLYVAGVVIYTDSIRRSMPLTECFQRVDLEVSQYP